jgi:hypothetical protein
MSLKYHKKASDWELPKMEVASHTNSPPLPWDTIDKIAFHYTGGDTVNRDTAKHLQASQSYYARVRGYSLGYNCAIDQDGVVWEIRGERFKCAANKGRNDETFAIHMLVDGQNPANPAMVAAARWMVTQIRNRSLNHISIVGHNDIGNTQCPGLGISEQIRLGVFEPNIHEDVVDQETSMVILGVAERVHDSRQTVKHDDLEIRSVYVGDHKAVFVNVTATGAESGGFVTLYGGGHVPNVSNLNFQKGKDICNASWVPVQDGHISVYTYGRVDLVIDKQAVV